MIGTYNSGCAAIDDPDPQRGVGSRWSARRTRTPGLTHGGPGTESGEPDKYYPTGERNYVRVVASDDNQGKIGAQYMKDDARRHEGLHPRRQGAVREGRRRRVRGRRPRTSGSTVVGHEGWDKDAQNYTALMTKIKATRRRRHLHRRRLDEQRRPARQGQGRDRRRQRRRQADRLRRLRALVALRGGRRRQRRGRVSAPRRPSRPTKLTGAGKKFVDDFQRGRERQAARGLHGLRGRGGAGARSTRSRAPTARARTCSRSCSRPTSPTRSSGRCRSTRTATRPARHRVRLLGHGRRRGRSRRPSRSPSTEPRGRSEGRPARPPRSGTSWRHADTSTRLLARAARRRSRTCCCWSSARSCCSGSATG